MFPALCISDLTGSGLRSFHYKLEFMPTSAGKCIHWPWGTNILKGLDCVSALSSLAVPLGSGVHAVCLGDLKAYLGLLPVWYLPVFWPWLHPCFSLWHSLTTWWSNIQERDCDLELVRKIRLWIYFEGVSKSTLIKGKVWAKEAKQ